MERSPYDRALDLLAYSRPAVWTARLAGVATALIYVLLVLVLGLFVDLVVTGGRLPALNEIPTKDRELVESTWDGLSTEDRAKALELIGMPPAWTGKDSPALVVEEVKWRTFAARVLEKRVGTEAAAELKVEGWTDSPNEIVYIGDDRRPHGILGLVVRHANTPVGRVLGTFASTCRWTWNGSDPNRAYLTGLLIMGVALVFVRGAAFVVMNETTARAALEAVTRLRRSIYHHTARQGAMTIGEGASTEAGELFNGRADQVHDAFAHELGNTWRNSTLALCLLLVGLVTHFWLAMAVLLLALIVWSIAGQLTVTFRSRGRLAARVAMHRLQLLLESLRQMRLVKSYLMEPFNQSRVERQLADYSQAHLRRARGDSFARPLLFAFASMAGLALLFLAGMVVLHGGLSAAGLVVLAVAVGSLYSPIRNRLSGRKTMRRGRESAAAIYEFLDRKGDVAQFPDAEFLPGVQKGIELADVVVREPGTGRLLLDRVSAKVKAGQKVGVVSADPVEAQTFVSLIPRFVDPSDGDVKIDGRNVKWLTHESLRSQVGMVLQSGLVFNDSVANNIGCGDPSFTLPQIIEAAKFAHAHQFIQQMPYGYETPIGELGHSLTPGQQFRIALARAILRDPAVFVIEEPVEHLDDDTKHLVDDTLDRALVGKTVIYLPHRVSTLRDCDKILLLHEGRLVAQGVHKELISENELYRHLYYLEYNPFAAEAPAAT